jgi:TM2 domain-containing membrane protein YozV
MNSGGTPAGADKKISAGICGILLGGFGIHKFILGYTQEGVIMLVVSIAGILLSCFFIPLLATMAMGVIGLAEGIIYLTKSDEEFVSTYITNKKGWF